MIDVPVEVKETLQDGRRKKNYRFNVLNDDGTVDFTIDNNTLVSESVNIDERMCSGDTLKFGLCEGSSLEFQYFDHPNIKGRRLQVFIDVDYTETYIDKDYETIREMDRFQTYTVTETGRYYVYSDSENNFDIVWLMTGESQYSQIIPANEGGKCFCEFDAQEGSVLEVEFPGWGYDPTYLQRVHVTKHTRESVHTIPMGFFTAKKCSRQASTGIIKVTAYNKLQSDYLDQKANQLLIDQLDDPSISLSLFSIRNTLLKDFEIDPYIYTQEESSGMTSWQTVKMGPNVTLTDLYADGGPINYYDLVLAAEMHGVTLTTSTPLALYLISDAYEWDVGPGDPDNIKYYQFIESKHNLGELTKSFAQYLSDFIDACPLSTSGETILRQMNRIEYGSGGWGYIFGIVDQRAGQNSKTYSDYGYYLNTFLGDYKVDGTTNDFVKTIIDDTIYTPLFIYIPRQIQVRISVGSGMAAIGIYNLIGDEPISYKGAEHSIKTYPQYKYTDGSSIPDTEKPFDDWFNLYEINGLHPADLVNIDPLTAADYSLRDLASADYETQCLFGQLSRETDLFSGVALNHQRLFPAEDLYPENTLYPGGAAMSSHRRTYSKLWGDDGDVKKWRYLIITYKGLDEDQKEKDFTLQRTVNEDGNVDYNMSDNWLFRNLIWTSAQVGEYADAMVEKMRDVTWFPFEMWCPGLPYLETGDEIEVSFNQNTYPTYILQRQLKGIQNLQDTYINGTLDIF